jgi:hypothetical protein
MKQSVVFRSIESYKKELEREDVHDVTEKQRIIKNMFNSVIPSCPKCFTQPMFLQQTEVPPAEIFSNLQKCPCNTQWCFMCGDLVSDENNHFYSPNPVRSVVSKTKCWLQFRGDMVPIKRSYLFRNDEAEESPEANSTFPHGESITSWKGVFVEICRKQPSVPFAYQHARMYSAFLIIRFCSEMIIEHFPNFDATLLHSSLKTFATEHPTLTLPFSLIIPDLNPPSKKHRPKRSTYSLAQRIGSQPVPFISPQPPLPTASRSISSNPSPASFSMFKPLGPRKQIDQEAAFFKLPIKDYPPSTQTSSSTHTAMVIDPMENEQESWLNQYRSEDFHGPIECCFGNRKLTNQ